MSKSKEIKARLQKANKRFWAGDNISAFIEDGEKQQLIDELAVKFEDVLQGLVIDTENDPNSNDTGRRLAKMYINELMAGRYDPMPKATAFPNDAIVIVSIPEISPASVLPPANKPRVGELAVDMQDCLATVKSPKSTVFPFVIIST